MTKQKTTKKALLFSVLSMMLCIAMLVGSTFAWFTDSVTSGKNKIVAGNLDVELYAKSGDDYAPVTADTNLFLADALWEPGHVETVNLKVANLGTLALTYQLGINIASEKGSTNVNDEAFKLSDYIKFAVLDGEQTFADRDAAIAAADATAVDLSAIAVNEGGVLYPNGKGEAEKLVTLVVYMPTTVGNEANYKTAEDVEAPEIELGINLVATQTPYENDSFGKNYDANATQEDEVVKYTFENDSDAIGFCPVCYNTGTTAAHADHAKYLIIKDGVAEVPQPGAWLSFKDLDWQNNAYVLEYDVDLKMLATGAFIAFDAGETTTWKDLHVGFKRTESGIEVYKTLFANSLNATKLLGEIGEKIHITYTFTPKANNLMMLATITDGEHTYTVENMVTDFPSDTVLCWNVYTAVGDEDIYATLDNVVFGVS